jgi:hypothetical protein
LKAAEIITALRAKNPSLVGDIDDKKAEQLLKAAFTLIRETVAATPQGEAVFPMLGRFRVHENVKGEGSGATTVRKIVYIPAKPQAKDSQAESAANAKKSVTA